MEQFQPFEIQHMPIKDQVMSWNDMIKSPYNKDEVDAYTRTRVILMNGIENNAVMTMHAVDRMIGNDDVKRHLAMLRRIDSQQQQTVNWLNPADQSVVETTIGYEQVAVDLTANLAKNEKNDYFRQVLDFALLEDFDHLFRYGCLMEILENKDPNDITQGKTEVKPGRPTVFHHRHPFDEMRSHFQSGQVDAKTWMNYFTIVSAEQQTMLFYKAHGMQYPQDLARKLYSEIADVEQQHVTQYELVGDPAGTPLLKLALLELNEAYNYYSCAMTESDPRIRDIWAQFCEMEVGHFLVCNELMKKYDKKDIRDVVKGVENIGPLIVFEPNKDYVNQVLETQVQLQPHDMKFMNLDELPADWPSFAYRDRLNADGVPSEIVVDQAKDMNRLPRAA